MCCIVTQRKYHGPLQCTVTLGCAHLLQMLSLPRLLSLQPPAVPLILVTAFVSTVGMEKGAAAVAALTPLQAEVGADGAAVTPLTPR